MSRRRYLISLLLWFLLPLFVAWGGVPILHRADEAIYAAAIGQKELPVRLLFPGETPRIVRILAPQLQREYPPVPYTMWEADASEPMPKLQELATIIHCLTANHSVSHVALSAPLTWADAGNKTVHLMLSNALSTARVFCAGLHGRNIAQAQPTPHLIRQGAIPPNCLTGDSSTLPSANAAYPAQLPKSDASVFCPDFTEDELLSAEDARSHGLSLPLLMRWNEEVYPTLPLCVAMNLLNLKPSDLRVHFGSSLRLGKRSVPLDRHGRTPLGGARAITMPLREVLQPSPGAPTAHSPVAVICRPMHESVDEERAKRLATTISCLLAENRTTYIPKMGRERATFLTLSPAQSTWLGVTIVWAVALATLFSLRYISLRTRFLLAIAGILTIYLFAYLSCIAGQWISISTWQLCWLLIITSPTPKPPPT